MRVLHSKLQVLFTPEIEELNSLTEQYYTLRDSLKVVLSEIVSLEQSVSDIGSRLTMLVDKCKQLTARESETENELESARERMSRQESRLQNARDVVKHNSRRAQKLVEGVDDWRTFQMAMWIRDYAEAANNALHSLGDLCAGAPVMHAHFAALVASTDIQRHLSKHQRRLHMFIQKIVSDSSSHSKEVTTAAEMDETVFSSSEESVRSGVSIASGYTKRLAAFRRSLAPKVQENALIDDIPETARRSTVSLRVVTLGLDESTPMTSQSTTSRRKSYR